MQSNFNQLQYQQMQIQQQQQRLAAMMQQKQRMGQTANNHFPPPPPSQQQMLHMQQQQQQQLSQQQRMQMMRPPLHSMGSSIPPHLQHQQQIPPHMLSMMPQYQHHQPPSHTTYSSISPSITTMSEMLPPAQLLATARAVQVNTETEKKNFQQLQLRDTTYQAVLNKQHGQHVELAQSKKLLIEAAGLERRTRSSQEGPIAIFGLGYYGFGNGKTGLQSKVRYRKKTRIARREFKFSTEALKEQASKEDVLVPIRIELEHGGYKFRDTFTWNLNEKLIAPEQFAAVICEDLSLPAVAFSDEIAKAIKEQLEDYNLNASSMLTTKDDDNTIEESVVEALELPTSNNNTDMDTVKPRKTNAIELRTIIKLDITVGNRELVDQFEWDICCTHNSPEGFAEKLCTDLGLDGEFKTAIAHSIREQIHVHIKSLLLVGYEFNSQAVIDDEVKGSFLPRLKRTIRNSAVTVERFTPSIIELTDAVIEKMEKDRMREARRKRRGTRARRGIILPDREPQKTHRTVFAVATEQEMTDEQFLNSFQVGTLHEQHQQVHHMTSKREAAIKARMNIANYENDDNFGSGV